MSLNKIISFNVAYGDCILLQFENETQADDKYFLLVDFGTRRKSAMSNGVKSEDCLESTGEEIEKIVKNSNMDILVTHCHEDHYNGIEKNLQNLKINKLFISNKDILTKLKEFVVSKNITPVFLSKKDNYTIHEYRNGNSESINIIWPNQTVCEFPSREEFLKNHCPGWRKIGQDPPSPGQISEHDICLVFEVEGKGNKWCLFTGDSTDIFNAYITNRAHQNKDDAFYYFFKSLPHKYSFIKAPHHGTKWWPLKSVSNSCEVLITTADSQDKSDVSSEYFNNTSITKVYMMNCTEKCQKNRNEGTINCEKCTLKTNKYLSSQIINL